ncbi:MAG TPA: hypothetical protein VKV73_22730 [Chloroflexota bacterium]|nr:hypothetical protein [Chloroflexota bacterium]
MTSKLSGIGTVTITSGGSTVTAPVPQLLSNLPLLHRILEDVILDWHRAVAPYEAKMTESPHTDSVMAVAFLELQPALLKCLFSYVMFFVAADRAYNALYASLNQANKTARVRHGKPPIATPLVEKARLIRDVSIAHFPSEKASHIDAWAGMSWQPISLSGGTGGVWNLRNLTFGSSRHRHTDSSGNVLAESQDFEVSGLDSLHHECIRYLELYDMVFLDYLTQLRAV